MTSAPALALSYRKQGTSTWVDLDPASSHGVAALARLGLQIAAPDHPTEEKEDMTATAIRRETVTPLRAPESATQQERFAFLLRMRERAAAFGARATALPRRALRKIIEALHLDSAWAYVKDGLGWTKDKALWVARTLGMTGMVGLAMTALSTNTGRSVITTIVGKPLGWALSLTDKVANGTITGLRHLGRPGNWVADKMQTVQDWTILKGAKAFKWYEKNVEAHTATTSLPMRATRLGGVLMLAQRAITGFGLPLPAIYLLAAGVAFWSVYDVVDLAISFGEKRGWLKVDEDKATGARKATVSGTAEVSTPGATAHTTTPAHKTAQGDSRRRH